MRKSGSELERRTFVGAGYEDSLLKFSSHTMLTAVRDVKSEAKGSESEEYDERIGIGRESECEIVDVQQKLLKRFNLKLGRRTNVRFVVELQKPCLVLADSDSPLRAFPNLPCSLLKRDTFIYPGPNEERRDVGSIVMRKKLGHTFVTSPTSNLFNTMSRCQWRHRIRRL
jgi:hypothetical protein